ncbi:MAG: glycosyltransferase family 4 protein [Candidatus Thermoplasmatota archaeon]|nr:glycosyltransferase family 4 protein [Candidatus Thermoplasmatota archaeon]
MSRIRALWEVRKNKGPINHITGDISYVALALPKKGLVITFHDLESLERNSAWRNVFLKWLWIKWPAKRAQKVTVISEHTKQKLIECTGIAEDKVVVIPNPLPEGFTYTPKEFDEEEPEILAIGTKYNKNLGGTIQALEGLNCRLAIIGKLTVEQKQLLEEKRIKYQNFVGISDEEMITRYKECDILCFPSFFEGFGMPIIEAQAIGRPVITSDYGAMKEVAGEGALLVEPENIEDIKERLIKIINNSEMRFTLIARGRLNARVYETGIVGDAYGTVYEECMT